VPCDPCSLATESVEPANEKSTCSAAEKVKSGDAATDTAEISNPPSLVDLAAQCVGGDCVKRRAWADSPMEPAAVQITSGSCYELDPTPQEAAAAEAAAAATAAAKTRCATKFLCVFANTSRVSWVNVSSTTGACPSLLDTCSVRFTTRYDRRV